MLDNPKLPPRLYYSLPQAAKELGCNEEYLLHLGVTNRLELVIRSHDLVGAFPSKMGQANLWATGRPTATFHNCLLCLNRYNIEEIENGELGECDIFTDAYIPDLGTTFCADDIAELQRIKNGGHDFIVYAALATNDDPKTVKESPLKPTPLEYSAKTVFVRREELLRLKEGKPLEPTKETPPEIARMLHKEPAPKQRNSYLRTIDALSRALTGSDLTEPKAAESVLASLAKAGIVAPIEARALSTYLKDARELRESN